MRTRLILATLVVLQAGLVSAQIVTDGGDRAGQVNASTPVQLQVPMGKSGLTVGVPVAVTRAGIAVGEPNPSAPGQVIARPAVQPPGYDPQAYSAPKESSEQKPRVLKRSEIPDWPQLKAN